MQKNKSLLIGLIAVLFIVIAALYLFFLNTGNYASTTKLLRFNYVVKNESEKLITEENFVAAIPVQIEGVQAIESINSSHEYQITNDDAQTVTFPLKNIAPYSSRIIDLTLIVKLTDKPKSDSAKSAQYLQSQKYIEADSAEVKELAAQLKGKTATETAKNIHQWLVNNISPSSYTVDSKGAVYLLKNRTGDCTEFMYTFIALARANGVPARGVTGFWIPGDSSLINAADYHDWAEFYDGEHWLLVDPLKNIFNENTNNYIHLGFWDPDKSKVRFGSSSQYLKISN